MTPVVPRDRPRKRPAARRRLPVPLRRLRATALVETLLAAPVVLLLGLGALQWALLFHARTAVEYAVFEAARAGSVAQARIDAIEEGLARGLMPFWQGTDALRPLPVALAESRMQLRRGLAAGWIEWRQISPTLESFLDWAEPARDADGRPVSGLVEIPNDSLQYAWLRMPAGGLTGMRGREPIGARSEQTLNDANLLKLELRYGVPMTVPLVGRIAVWALRIIDRCEAPSRRVVGLVDLGTPAPSAHPRAWTCAFYQARDEHGRPVPRWPVRASALVRMQSAARRTAMTLHRNESPVRRAVASAESTSAGSGWLDPAGSRTDDTDVGRAPGGTPGSAPAEPDESYRASGWLRIGGDRTFTVPGACG